MANNVMPGLFQYMRTTFAILFGPKLECAYDSIESVFSFVYEWSDALTEKHEPIEKMTVPDFFSWRYYSGSYAIVNMVTSPCQIIIYVVL